MKKILVMNGPNLNMLGIRKKEVYGTETLDAINRTLADKGQELGAEIEFFQSNSEGALIDKLQSAYGEKDGVILNAGAYTHYSYAIRDAIEAIQLPVIEVHLSNIHARDEFRHKSVIGPVCSGSVIGFGAKGYLLALIALVQE